MEIKGFQGISIVDFPGRISSIVFVAGCNFRCPYCYNTSLVLYPQNLPTCSTQDLLLMLKDRVDFIDGIVITGGEPSIHEELTGALELMKSNFSDKKIKLDTNGSHPYRIKHYLSRGLVDYIALDFKAPFEDYLHLSPPDGIQESWRETQTILRNFLQSDQYEYRSTLHRPFFDLEKLQSMSSYIDTGERWFWQNYVNPDTVLDPDFKGTPVPTSLLREWKDKIAKPGISLRDDII